MFAYCGNSPITGFDPTGELNWGTLFKGVGLLATAVAAVTVAVPILMCASAGALITTVAAVTLAAGTLTAVNGAAEVVESVTGYNVVRDGVFNGNTAAYEAYRDTTEAVAKIGTAICGAYTAARGGNVCFVAGTLVRTDSGSKPIEDIEPGDQVWAWDEATGDVSLKPVVETYVNETEELVHLQVNGEEIVCTPTHPFYSPVKGWTEAVRLRAGDILVLVNGEYVVVEKVQHELLESPIKVYNFQVADYHTYYVANIGVLVHNICAQTEKTEIHHIVEQCQANKSGIPMSDIQSPLNKIEIPYSLHRKISGYYSSKPKFTGGLRVRDWLAGKSFDEQFEFGMNWLLNNV